MTYFILISIYLLSAFFMYKWVQYAHSKNGIVEYSNPDLEDIMTVFIPCINTFLAMFAWTFYYPKKNHKVNTDKFFRVKK